MDQNTGARQGSASLAVARIETSFAPRTWSLSHAEGSGAQIFLLTGGAGALIFGDGKVQPLEGPAIAWVPAGQRGSFRIEAGGEGFHVAASEALLWRTIGDSAAATDIRPVMDRPIVAVELPNAMFDQLWVAFEALVQETHTSATGGPALIVLNLGIILIHLLRLQGGEHTTDRGGASIVARFQQLIELHFREDLGIDGYATLLGATRGRLHDACLKVAGRTPLALIHGRLLEEARGRLAQTDMSVEQVGFSLGFHDAAYFNRFFRRLSGETPGSYRRAARQAQGPAAPPSFASWP